MSAVTATAPTPLPTTAALGNTGASGGKVYSVVFTQPTRVAVNVTPQGMQRWTPRVVAFNAMGDVLPDTGMGIGMEEFAFGIGTFSLVVSDANFVGRNRAFGISPSTSALAPNSVCNAPTPLVIGVPLMGEQADLGGAPFATCGQTRPRTRYYSVTAPASSVVSVSAPGPFNVSLSVVDSCTSTACVATSVPGLSTVSFRNAQPMPRTFIVAVGTDGNAFIYSLSVSSQPLAPNRSEERRVGKECA